LGEVLSHAAGYDSLVSLIGPVEFHTVCMVLGVFFWGKILRRPKSLRLPSIEI
jgi:hypothetical protein